MRRKDREVVGKEALSAILDAADSCRIAFVDGGEPYIVALNYGWSWDGELPRLYFHSARAGRKIELLRSSPRVCFQLDADHQLVGGADPCDWGMKYAGIVGWGTLRELESGPERVAALESVMRHYGWDGSGRFQEPVLGATAVLELEVERMSGKRKA